MTLLRTVLLALALVVFAAIGWRMAGTPGMQPPRTAVAGGPTPTTRPPSAPIVPPPAKPAVATPASPAPPSPPAAPAPPPVVTPPVAPATPAAPVPPAGSSTAAVTSQPGTAGTMTVEEARKAIQAHLQDAPDLARVFDAITAAFPAVAERTLSGAADALRISGQMPSPDDFIAATMRDLRLSSGVLAARAGADAMAAIFEAKAATLADLEAADPRICADYLFGSTSPEFNDFVVAHRALVARSSMATIAAMADGRTRQMSWGAPTQEDYGSIEQGLAAKGLSAAEIAALLDGKPIDPPPSDTRLCDNMRAYLDVIRAMPADARNRVYGLAAELLARS